MDESEKALAAYKLISGQIARENNIVHQRTTAGLSINGILATLAAASYSVARDRLKEPRDSIIFGLVILALAFVAIWVSFSAIRGIAVARTQNAYIRDFYENGWKKNEAAEALNLPRPFGGPGYADKNAAGQTIKEGAGGAGTLFRAVIVIWMIALAMLIAASVKWFLGE